MAKAVVDDKTSSQNPDLEELVGAVPLGEDAGADAKDVGAAVASIDGDADLDAAEQDNAPAAGADGAGEPTGEEAGEDGGEGDADAKPVYSPALLAAAGMTAEEAQRQFGSPGELASAIARLDARFVQSGASTWGLQQQPLPPFQQQVPLWPQPPPTQNVPAVQQMQQPAVELPKPADGTDWDDDTKRLLGALMQQQHAELARRDQVLAQQSQALSAIVQQQQQVASRQYVESFDNFIDGLGPEWEPVLGKGSGYALQPNSLALQNRVHLDMIAAQLEHGRALHGQPPLPQDQLRARALYVAFPDHQEKAVRQQVTQQITQRKGMMTQRPTQRRSKPITGIEKACQTAGKFYKDRGYIVEDLDDLDQGTF